MRKYFSSAYDILTRVYSDGQFGDRALREAEVDDMTTRLVYGVLEKDVLLDFILAQLAPKKPKPPILLLLKIGAYSLMYLDNVPDYAVVSELIETANTKGKGGVSGFLNAVLKKVARKEFSLPKPDDRNYLSIHYSLPQWFINRLQAQFGAEDAERILSEPPVYDEHIRPNTRIFSINELKAFLDKKDVSYRESEVGGLFVRVSDEIKKLFAEGRITYQSPSSMTVAVAVAPKDGEKILDLCSAPGGKSIYIAELARNANITACDISSRLGLIRSYAGRMKADNIEISAEDGTVFCANKEAKFDKVLVDAPCSCFGTFKKHPDVLVNKSEKNIEEHQALQIRLLTNAMRYVKRGGSVIYSTCTLFDEENGNIIQKALEDENFCLEKLPIQMPNEGSITILPENGYDGFYIARLKKL